MNTFKTLIKDKNLTITIEGTASEIRDAIKKLGYSDVMSPLYNSSSLGLIPITKMETNHIRNAVLKMVRENQKHLRQASNIGLATMLYGFFDGTDFSEEFNALLDELEDREDL